MPGRGTTDAIFALIKANAEEVWRKTERAIFHINRFRKKKTYDGVPREEMWKCKREYQKSMYD